MRNTRASIGGTDLEIWAESPRQAIAVVPGAPHDLQHAVVSDASWTHDSTITVLAVRCTPRKRSVEAGDEVRVTLEVDGIGSLIQEEAPVLSVQAWLEEGSKWRDDRTHAIRVANAQAGRVVIEETFTVPARGTFRTLARLDAPAQPD